VNGSKKLVGLLYGKLSPVTAVANAIAMVALAGMMFLTAVDVIGRKLFNSPIMGSYELIQFMMAITIGFGLAHCGMQKAHINIDLIIMHLSKRVNATVGIVTGFIAFVMIGIATWQTCIYITRQASTNVESSVLHIPVYPFVAIVALGLAMYCVVLIIHWMEFILQGTTKEVKEK
jgi:TRAP-type C4-dicarboxylate transport system permease small subunit